MSYQSGWVPGRGFTAGQQYPQQLEVGQRYQPYATAYRASQEVWLTDGFDTYAGEEIVVEIAIGTSPLQPPPGGEGDWQVYGQYRYGFNGKENDNEVKGTGNQQDYGMRIYDPRLGRFLSVDPLAKSYAMLTPYQFASNRPIDGIDIDGLEFYSPETAKVTPLITYDPILKTITSIDIFLNYQNITNGLKAKVHEQFKLRGKYFDDNVVSAILLTSVIFQVPEKPKDLNEGLSTVEGDNGVFETKYTKILKSSRLVKTAPTSTQVVTNSQGKAKADKASAIIEIVSYGLDKLYEWYEGNVEIPKIEGQAKFMRKSLLNLFNRALDSKIIPNEYLNTESLTAIAEFIISGNKPMQKLSSGKYEVDQNLLDVSKQVWGIIESDRIKSSLGDEKKQKIDNTNTKSPRQ